MVLVNVVFGNFRPVPHQMGLVVLEWGVGEVEGGQVACRPGTADGASAYKKENKFVENSQHTTAAPSVNQI